MTVVFPAHHLPFYYLPFTEVQLHLDALYVGVDNEFFVLIFLKLLPVDCCCSEEMEEYTHTQSMISFFAFTLHQKPSTIFK